MKRICPHIFICFCFVLYTNVYAMIVDPENMESYELNYGSSRITLIKSKQFIGVKPASFRTDTRDNLHSILGEEADKFTVIDKNLGGFQVLKLETSEDLNAKLDTIRSFQGVEKGTHVYHKQPQDLTPAVPTGELYVKFKKEVPLSECAETLNQHALQVLETRGKRKNKFVVSITPSARNPVKTAQLLQTLESVEIAEPDLAVPVMLLGFEEPQDEYFPLQWHLRNKGDLYPPSEYKVGADANVVAAWKAMDGFGSSDIVVAVIDTGFDIGIEYRYKVAHPCLRFPFDAPHFPLPLDFLDPRRLSPYSFGFELPNTVTFLPSPLWISYLTARTWDPIFIHFTPFPSPYHPHFPLPFDFLDPRRLSPYSFGFEFPNTVTFLPSPLWISGYLIDRIFWPPPLFDLFHWFDEGHPDLTNWRDRLIAQGIDLFHECHGRNQIIDIFRHENTKIWAPWDFIENDDKPRPNRRDPNLRSEDAETKAEAIRNLNHGTRCAGIAVGKVGGGKIVGVAPNAKLMPVRMGPISDDAIEKWFDYVIGADVVNCSWRAPGPLGGGPLSTRQSDAIKKCAAPDRNWKGRVVVFAAGNDDSNINDRDTGYINGFATHPDVIAVAASTSRDEKASYSNFGDAISICAPGGDYYDDRSRAIGIMSSSVRGWGNYTNDYTSKLGGTSSAAAIVSGVAALMLSVNPNLTSKQVKEILETTARKIGEGYDSNGHSKYFGYGCVNAEAAVKKAIDMR